VLESFFNKKRDVTGALSELASLANEVGAKSLSGRIDADLVQKLDADRFHLVVVGEFNHGKTTFVNALLGAQVLPVGVTPTTAVIHHLEYADTPRAEVVTMGGERRGISFEEVRRFSVGADPTADQNQGLGPNDTRYLEVGFPAALLRERIVLVDTPGVNDLSLQRADVTYSYIPKSDAVLFLLDAGQPLKESERVFLQDKLLGQSRNKIIFIVTKADIWDDGERTEALKYIRGELGKLMGEPPLFAISAEAALEGRTEESRMPELIDHLTKFLAEERGRILLDNALGEGVGAASVLRRGIDARRRAAAMPREELTRRIEALEKDLAGQSRTIEQRRGAIREEIAAIKAWVRRDLDHFCEDVARQIPAMVDSATTDEIKLHLGPFMEKTLVNWAESETKEIAGALEALAEKTIALVRDDAHDVAKRVSSTLGPNVQAPNVEVDTFGYDVGVVALFTVGFGMIFTNALLGGLLTAAAPVLAMYVKGRVEKETRDKARDLAPAAMREAAARIGPKLDEMIGEFAERLDAWVVTAGEELHRELIEVLTASRTERDDKSPEVESAVKTCDEQDERLEKVIGRLTGLRAALAVPENGEMSTDERHEQGVPNSPGGTA
jgi:ribosome biogenesis GTPase A